MLYNPNPTPSQADLVKLRHYCRNPKCRSKLESPVENERDAFCCRGCHGSFYRHRCLACEREMPRNSEHQKVCYRADCKEKWRQKTILSRFVGQTSTPDGNPPENSIKPGVKTGLNSGADPGLPWRQVAGPSLTPTQLRVAAIGAKEAFELDKRLNARFWREAESLAAEQAELATNGFFTEPEWRLFVSPDACERYHGKFYVTRFRQPTEPIEQPVEQPAAKSAIDWGDLSIPGFLRRTPTESAS